MQPGQPSFIQLRFQTVSVLTQPPLDCRALLVREHFVRGKDPPMFDLSEWDNYLLGTSDRHVSISQTDCLWRTFSNLKYFSLNCLITGPSPQGPESTTHSVRQLESLRTAFLAGGYLVCDSVLQNITHLEIVGYRVPCRIFKQVNANQLVEVSLCLPPTSILYSKNEAAAIFGCLASHPVRNLTISLECFSCVAVISLARIQTLVNVSLIWHEESHVYGRNISVLDCGRDSYVVCFATSLNI